MKDPTGLNAEAPLTSLAVGDARYKLSTGTKDRPMATAGDIKKVSDARGRRSDTERRRR